MSILAKYVVLQFVRVLGLSLVAVVGLYLIVDIFERVPGFLKYQPPASAIVGYFVLKLPELISNVFPAACLLSILISMGTMAGNHEILAVRSCGISTWHLATPLLSLALISSFVVIAWNEMIVPPTYSYSRYLNDVVIKKKDERGIFNASSVWFQAPEGVYHIDYYDNDKHELKDLTLYRVDNSFRVKEVVEVRRALWKNGRWVSEGVSIKTPIPGGGVIWRKLEDGSFEFTQPPKQLAARKREPEEFSFLQLTDQIRILEGKGRDASEFKVYLHRKLAWPLAGFIVVLVGFPLAVRGGRRAGVARNLTTGLAVGLAYWVLTGAALSAGTSGELPAVLAAWGANIIFAAVAAGLYLSPKTS